MGLLEQQKTWIPGDHDDLVPLHPHTQDCGGAGEFQYLAQEDQEDKEDEKEQEDQEDQNEQENHEDQ